MNAYRSVLWRIHFWAALIASPFVLAATLTGVLYIFTPQIEAWQHGWLDRVEAAGAVQPLDDAVAAARTAAPPGWRLQSVLPGYGPAASVKAVFEAQAAGASEHAGHQHGAAKQAPQTIYVNPYTAQVIGSLANDERFGNWSKRLHSRLLQGDGWRWMIELAASAMLVMLLTGVALWWPNGTQKALPTPQARGRSAWKQWHAFLGVALCVLTATMLVTGLTWSKYAGGQIRTLRDIARQAPPTVPRDVVSHAAPGLAPIAWQAAWSAAKNLAPDVAFQMIAPIGAHGTWKFSAADPSQPTRRFDLLLDAYDGSRLYFAGWDQQTLFGKATAIGIPFHRGEFGWWNQALLLLFGLGVLFSLLSGWVMYFKRRRRGALALPQVPAGAWKAAAMPVGLAGMLLCWIMPVLAIAVGAVALIEVFPVLARRR